MNEFFFVSRIDQKPRASLVERDLIQEAASMYLDKILSARQLEEIVSILQEMQEDMISGNRRLNRVEIRVEKFDHLSYLFVGKSSLWLRPVRCSDKEAAASELFNDGWWNCLDSFAYSLEYKLSQEDMRRIFFEVMEEAGVSGVEADIRKDGLGNHAAKDIVEDYASMKFVE